MISLVLQTIIIAQMVSIGGKGAAGVEGVNTLKGRGVNWLYFAIQV